MDKRSQIYSMARPVRANAVYAWGLAALLLLAAAAIRQVYASVFDLAPFLPFVVAVVAAAYFSGTGPATAALAGGAVIALGRPLGADSATDPALIAGLLLYLISGGFIILLQHGHYAALAEAEDARQHLARLNADLERRVAERTAALEEQIRARSEAEALSRHMQRMESIGQLTGGIAHDFNNMLAIIIGSLDLAQRRLEAGALPRVAQCIANAQDGAQRAATLTSRLLAYSRQQPLAPGILDLNRLVAGISELLRRTIGEHIRLETVLAGGLWPAFADATQLENALVNLVVNARDAMPEGGRLTIETGNAYLDEAYARAHAEVTAGQYVLLSVTDTGTGMAAEVVEHAFDPFYTTKGPGRGTGLGLSQVYGFVKQSGGHVKIYSEAGQGTAVKIYLPRHLGAAAPAPEAPADAEIPRGSAATMILVVEDDPGVRATTVEALRDLGYRVTAAADGAQALDMLGGGLAVDLLFTDIVMPDMSGRQIADAVAARWPGLPVLFTTGYTRNAVVHNGMLDAGVAFLAKPFSIAQLAYKIADVLAGRGANRA
jgi:signal transduction histidine kinase/CheY-like chemotaxis protein